MGSVRLDPQMTEKVRQVAAVKGLTLSEVHRQALTEYVEREMPEKKISRYDDIIGVGEGPPDLARRHKEYFAEIMDEKYRRHTD
jgi:Arc/MetJ-type ribon-helix-helix transcriptional regulator